MSGDAWTNAGAIPAGGSTPSSASAPQPASADPWAAAGAISASAGQVPQQAQTPPEAGDDAPAASQGAVNSKSSGIRANLAAGAVEGVGGNLSLVPQITKQLTGGVDVGGVISAGLHGVGNLLPDGSLKDRYGQVVDAIDQGLRPNVPTVDKVVGAVTGFDPSQVSAATAPERIARSIGAGATSAFVPEGEALTAGRVLARGAVGAAAGAGSGVAQEAAPDNLKSLVGTAAAVATGLAAHGAGAVAKGAANAVSDAVAPFAANVSKGAAETQAARVLATNASDPAAVKAALQEPTELVPGSTPTTFQATGDMGLGSLERTVATRDPTPFNQRRADQGVARTTALSDIQNGADPNDVAEAVRAHLDALDQQTQGQVDQAVSSAQAATNAAGGQGMPEDYGTGVRGAVSDARAASRTSLSKLYDAVDPNKDLTGNVSTTKAAANQIVGAMRPTEKPMDGEEAAIFAAAQGLPQLAPAADLVALKQRVNDAAEDELSSRGATSTYARLSQLRSAINENLSTTIAQKVAADDAAVARGTLAPEDALLSRLKGEQDAFYANRTQARLASGGGAEAQAGSGSGAFPGLSGAEVPEGRGSGGAAGPQGLPPNAQPTFDDAARQRLSAADTAYAQHAQTFDQGPVAKVLGTTGYKDQFRLPDGSVASKFFHPGPTGFTDMQALLRATDPAVSQPLIENYAASTLRRMATRDDGVVDPAKFERWRAQHQDAIRVLSPEAQAKLASAASAGEAVAEATGARVQAMKDARAGAIGKVMGLATPQDVTRTVGSILGSDKAGAEMLQLARATKDTPEARAGLRQAIADHIKETLIGNTEAGTSGTTQIKADQFQTFMRTSRPALNLMFTPEEVASMEAVAKDIQRSQRSANATKSPASPGTAQDLVAASKGKHHVATGVLDIAGTLLGHHFGGEAGAMVGGFGTHMLQSMRAAGISKVDQLVTTALLHPSVAKALLEKIPDASRGAQRAAAYRLSRALYRVLPATAANQKRAGEP